MSQLNESALLVQLSVSQWMGRKVDKRVSDEVTSGHGASREAGRFNKSLMAGSDYLADVHKKTGWIRTKFYENTLPWGIEGTQLLPSKNYMEFMATFRKERSEWEQLVEKFVGEYAHLVDEARLSLGSLFSESDYPLAEQVRLKFRMDMAVFPVPSGDFRVTLSNEEREALERDVEERVRSAQALAMRDVWQRLYDKVEAMSNKLSDPSAIFRNSLVENVAELCSLLPKLNFADDPNLEEMRLAVERRLAAYDPDVLRTDLDLRRDTAKEATQIMDKMRGFMEGL